MSYEKNLNFIKSKFPHLVKELNKPAINAEINIEISQSRTGMPVLRLSKNGRKVFLSSAYDPQLEAERWAEKYVGNGNNVLILCGSGFLYHLKAILKQGIYQKIVCYEPAPAILKACLREVDLSEIKGEFLLLTGDNYRECTNLASSYLTYQIFDSDWAILPSYQEFFAVEIAAFQNTLRELIRIDRANLATANLFGEKWATNAIRNLGFILNSPGVTHFFNQFNNVPAIIVSAGPSLEKNIHLLNEIKEKALIICAGTSIRAMRKFGVKPHFLVAFDGTDYNKTIYSNLDLNDICLVYNYRFNHEALSYFSGKKAYMKLDMETFSDFLALQCGYEFGAVRSGFSVAHPSLDLATKLGCSPIIMIGQDLAYTGDKRYAESQFQTVVNRQKLPAHCFITKDINGRDIVTDNQLDSFRLLFEQMVAEYYRGKRIFNATEGGQPIKGVPNYQLAHLISEYCQNERGISRRIKELYNLGLKDVEKFRSRKINLVSGIKNMAEEGIFKIESLIDQVQQLKQMNFSAEASQNELSEELNQATKEFESFITAKERHLFLKDLRDWKIAPNQIAIANLGRTETKEGFNSKLQYWENIFGETKGYLEYVIRQLDDEAIKNEGKAASEIPSIVQIAALKTPGQIAIEIKSGGQLNEIQSRLETIINQGNGKGLNEYRYLYGLVLYKKKEFAKAAFALEQAHRNDNDAPEISFLLFKCYRRLQNFTKIQECLENCLRLGFKPGFCQRMLVKNAYRSKNYIAVNNYISGLKTVIKENPFYRSIRIDCLHQLQLNREAEIDFQDLVSKTKVGKTFREYIEGLLGKAEVSNYENKYRSSYEYFTKKGVAVGDFSESRLKLCRYLDNEYIYDNSLKRFLLAVNESGINELKFSTNDTLLIYNTDDSGIYNTLKQMDKVSQDISQSLALTPIFIIEDQPANWQLMMQRFDFNELAKFQNIHFLIGINNEELEQLWQEDSVPLPSLLFGTGLDDIKQILEKVSAAKESVFQKRLADLQDYYRRSKPDQLKKILIITSIKEDLLLEYGKALQLYLKEQGFEVELDCESAPYYKFNKYADLNILDGLRPDLVIHLFAMAEELEAYQGLGIPFISWRIIDRWLVPNAAASYNMEKVLISGESWVNSSLADRGFLPDQIKPVVIPYLSKPFEEALHQGVTNEVVIVKDLKDQERILEALTVTTMGVLTVGGGLLAEEIIANCRTAFFKLLTGLMSQSSLTTDDQFYQEVVREEFQKKGITIENEKIQLIAGLFRRELEDSLLTLIQVKWMINSGCNYKLRLHGTGWENDLNLKNHQGAAVKLFDKGYRHVVLQSKINVYPELMLKNNSFMQPDLINGIAGGGFFLVNGSLVGTIGKKVLEPFAGLLEIYRNREELLDKVDYFLKNEAERVEKAGRLREYVLENFSMDKVAQVMFDAYQGISK